MLYFEIEPSNIRTVLEPKNVAEELNGSRDQIHIET